MHVTLNGKSIHLSGATDLGSLAGKFCKDKTPVVAEVNGKIVKDIPWEDISLNDGDTVELVSFVGGGSIDIRNSLSVVRCSNNEQPTTNNHQL